MTYCFLTRLRPMFHCYTPWKHPKNLGFSAVFRGYRNGTLTWKGLVNKVIRWTIKTILEKEETYRFLNERLRFFFFCVQNLCKFPASLHIQNIHIRSTLNVVLSLYPWSEIPYLVIERIKYMFTANNYGNIFILMTHI